MPPPDLTKWSLDDLLAEYRMAMNPPEEPKRAAAAKTEIERRTGGGEDDGDGHLNRTVTFQEVEAAIQDEGMILKQAGVITVGCDVPVRTKRDLKRLQEILGLPK